MVLTKRKAFTMVEILIAVGIFSLMILPMLFISSNQNRNAYSVSKHLMAYQIASSFMDDILSKTYDYLIENEKNYTGKGKLVTDHEVFKNMIKQIDEEENEVKKELEKDFASFRYDISFNKYEKDKIIEIYIKIDYSIFNNDINNEKTRAYVKLKALKHGYKFYTEEPNAK